MNNLRKICVTFLLSFMAVSGSAQPYDLIERRNPWNAGTNAAGLRTDSVTISYAELYGSNDHGDFRDSYQADKALGAGVVAKTITHTKNYSMTGSFSYDRSRGSNMSGSMFIYPGFYPVDVLEFTPGRKDLQTYAFMGGIAVDIAPKWRIGGKIDFASSNYSKRKDLRHTNYRLDLKVSPGVMYHWGDYSVGLSYIFGKNSESVSAEEIGTSASTYYAFLDKGLMYGAYEAWSGSGTHLSEAGVNGFPVKEITHGAGLQAQWSSLYADIEYLYTSGSVGEKQTIWFEFPKHSISSRIAYRIARGSTSHFLRLNIEWSRQKNNENVLSKEISNGITLTHVHGSKRIFERDMLSVNPEYEVTSPGGEFRIGAEVSSLKRLTTQMYPYIISQSMIRSHVYASGTIHIKEFDLKGGVSFTAGNITEESREIETETEAGDPPSFLSDYYNIQNEYMTAPQIMFTLGLRYNFLKGLYAEIDAGYTRGFNLKYIDGSDRWYETIKLGYTF